VRITAVLYGSNARADDVITMRPEMCRPGPVVGVDYYVGRLCLSGSGCEWIRVETDHVKGFEDYIKQRHFVNRVQVIEKLRAWGEYRLATADFRRWLATTDADDDDVRGPSLTLAVVDETEELLDFVQAAESCQPQSVAWFREFGAKTLIDRFGKLPPEEKESAYEAWLDAHEGSEDQWDTQRLEKDLEAALERDVSWSSARTCVRQWQRKRWLETH